MAVAKGLVIEGVDDLKQVLDAMAPKAARNLARATVQGVAGEVAKEVRKKAPKRTGNLRKAIKAKRRRPKNPDQFYSDVVSQGKQQKNDGFYWRFVEFGTQKLPEQPFIRPVVDVMRPELPRIYREQFGKKLEGQLRRAAKKSA